MVGVFSLCPQMSRHVPLRPLNVNQGIRRDKMTLARKDTIGVLKATEANQVSMLFVTPQITPLSILIVVTI